VCQRHTSSGNADHHHRLGGGALDDLMRHPGDDARDFGR
jgi:hypothetical protein